MPATLADLIESADARQHLNDAQKHHIGNLNKAHPFTEPYTYKAIAGFDSVEPTSRTDISWISTEARDRYGDIMKAAGCDFSLFRLNPIVPKHHDYKSPAGRSLWQRITEDAGVRGIQAKTFYPPKPANRTEPWIPDDVWEQITNGLLNAKSIGFQSIDIRGPTPAEINQGIPRDTRIHEKWLLVEYSVGVIGVNPETVITAIQKSLSPEQLLYTALQAADFDSVVRNVLNAHHGAI